MLFFQSKAEKVLKTLHNDNKVILFNIKKALENNRLNGLLIPQQPAPGTVANQTPTSWPTPRMPENSFKIMTKR